MPTEPAEGLETLGQFFSILSAQSVSRIIGVLVILLFGWVAIRYINRLVLRLFRRSDRLDPSAEKLIARGLHGLLVFVLILICMAQLRLPITSLVTVLGAIGLAASLAMQDSLKNIAGGLIIMTTRPFVTGHFIETALASGTVSEIGLVHTQLTTVDNRRVYVPNGQLAAATVTNYSLEQRRRVELTIPIPYAVPIGQARAAIEAVVAAETRVLPEPAPFIRVWDISQDAVSVIIRVWTLSGDFFEVRSALLEAIKDSLDRHGMAVPFTRLDVRAPDSQQSPHI